MTRQNPIIIQGFHVTPYQASFASHHTCDHHVGFLFTPDGIGKNNNMFQYCVLFYFIPHYQITTEWQEYLHTNLIAISNPLYEVNQKLKHFFPSLPHCTKGTRRGCQIVHPEVHTASYKPSFGQQSTLVHIQSYVRSDLNIYFARYSYQYLHNMIRSSKMSPKLSIQHF